MPQNSLSASLLHEQSFSVANESCSGHKKQQKTVPHPLPPINKLQSPHEIKSQPINRAALTIQMVAKPPLVSIWEEQMAISHYGGKDEC